jgi:hypothetical protein
MAETAVDIFEDAENNQFYLTVTDTDDDTYALFMDLELQGGGYTWLGLVESLIELRAPDLRSQLHVLDAEGDNMYAYAKRREPLDDLAGLIRSAVADRTLMMAAIEHAGDDLE